MKEKIAEFLKGAVFALLYIGIFLGMQVVLTVIGGVVAHLLGYDMEDTLVNLTGPVSLFTALITLCALWGISYVRGFKKGSIIKIKKLTIVDFGLGFVMAIGMRVLTNAYMLKAEETPFLKEAIESAQNSMNFDTATPLGIVVMSAAVCIVAPVVEEIVFRGFIQYELKRAGGIVFAIITQAVLFALAHMNAAQIIFTFVIGAIIGFIYHRTGNIKIAILIHMVFNCSVVMELKNTEYMPITILIGVIMVVVPFILIGLLHRKKFEEII